MPRPARTILAGLLAVLAVSLLLGGCARKPLAPPDIVQVDERNFSYEVLRQPGPTLVLFHTLDAPQSQAMYARLSWLSQIYKGKLKFCAYTWDLNADPAPYRLEMLPTLVLYRDGWEIDRMRGIPADAEAMRKLNDDLELWVLRTGLELTYDPRFQAQFTYRYNNTNRLQAGN